MNASIKRIRVLKEVLTHLNRKRLTKEGKRFVNGIVSGFVEAQRLDPHTMFEPEKSRRAARRAFKLCLRASINAAKLWVKEVGFQSN